MNEDSCQQHAFPPGSRQSRVFGNAMLLVVAQVLAMPLSILINAVMARHLGPADFGDIFIATTYANFAFLVVEWGQSTTLQTLVVGEREGASRFLGTAMLWRTAGALLALGTLLALVQLLGYPHSFWIVLVPVCVSAGAASLIRACQTVIAAFERTDIAAYATVLQQVVVGCLVIPALLLGWQVGGVLLLQAAGMCLLLLFVVSRLSSVGIIGLNWSSATARTVFALGPTFVVLALTTTLQSSFDATFISKLAPPDVVGWQAAASRLVGVLIFPANAIVAALYPTLARLSRSDMNEFKHVTGDALSAAMLFVVPVALGCILYPDLGIRIFSEESYGPAKLNLQVSSFLIFMLFFSMPLSCALVALGRQRAWTVAQAGCLVISVILDPVLIPLFQRLIGNGGVGLCIANNFSEGCMVAAAIYLLPPGIFTPQLLKKLALILLSGAAMIATALAIKGVSPFISAPLAVLAYLLAVIATGGFDRHQLLAIRGLLGRRLVRFRGPETG